jgi:hypothetical protein
MKSKKLKIPIIAITVADLEDEEKARNIELLEKNTYYDRTLYNADKLKELTDVAHLFMGVIDGTVHPLTVHWLRAGKDIVNDKDGSFDLEKVATFNYDSFKIVDGYDAATGAKMPKYVIINIK